MRTLLLLSLLAPGIALAQTEAAVRESLRKAVVCTPDPIKTVSNVVDAGSAFDAGYAAYGFGDGEGYKAVVILRLPITVAGAKANAVVAETGSSHFDFNGIVYGRFTGDYRKAVSELKLGPAVKRDGVIMGTYERRLDIDNEGKPYDLCPLTIVLTPTKNNEFLLGCGWCPG